MSFFGHFRHSGLKKLGIKDDKILDLHSFPYIYGPLLKWLKFLKKLIGWIFRFILSKLLKGSKAEISDKHCLTFYNLQL